MNRVSDESRQSVPEPNPVANPAPTPPPDSGHLNKLDAIDTKLFNFCKAFHFNAEVQSLTSHLL
jgi:hypothetical protein